MQIKLLIPMICIKSRHAWLVILPAFLFMACKKEDLARNVAPAGPSQTTVTAKDKDSALLYARDIYLWYNQLPESLHAGSFSDLDKLMTGIRLYSMEPGFNNPVDRWSFAIPRQEWDAISAGAAADFGLGIFFRAESDLRVKSVQPGSAAGRAGIRRGWRIVAINGNANMQTGNTSFIAAQVTNSSRVTFSFLKPDNTNVQLTLDATGYQEQPVLADSLYQVNGRKVAYFVFNSFLGDTASVYLDFHNRFNDYVREGVQDLVIDLRYNGGGYVTVQEKLANYLVPSSRNGQVMMTQQFNDKNSDYNRTSYFHKKGNLNLPRIFFIVGRSTASASELLVNNLRPHLDIILVGSSKTYGKPVGYFPIPVNNSYIFPVSFRIVNSRGEGGYFEGLPVHAQAADGLDKDWGDVQEPLLAKVIQFISDGTFGPVAGRIEQQAISNEMKQGNAVLEQNEFKGVIDTRGMR